MSIYLSKKKGAEGLIRRFKKTESGGLLECRNWKGKGVNEAVDLS